MALRATSGPTVSKNSLRVGEVLVVSAKVENTGAEPEGIELRVEGHEERFVFEPQVADVPKKSRRVVEFRWAASLPDDKPALTYRGKLVLQRKIDGKRVGEAPLDVYVSRG